MNKILVVDDEERLRNLLVKLISLEGFEVFQASNCKLASQKLEKNEFTVMLCDVKLPDGNGVDFAIAMKQIYPKMEIVLLTAYGTIPDSVKSIKGGIFDYITKGDNNNQILPLIYKAIEKYNQSKEVTNTIETEPFNSIIGTSESIKKAIYLAKKVAQTDSTVLLTGETGTGKEVFAQAIHNASTRKSRKFVAINCSVFSKDLLENEMFGHITGAFTGATKDQQGLLESADKGTIFLDEIGEMNIELQAKLLRVIETGEFYKLGESKTTKVDVRIIAATNRGLEQEIHQGRFREDLYYRLSVFQIQLPPLRSRKEDVELLALHFLDVFKQRVKKKDLHFSDVFLRKLKELHYKGNIRELRNIIERAVILSEDTTITEDTLPLQPEFVQDENTSFELNSIEKKHIQKVLDYVHGNKTKAAELLGIAITTLYRKIEEYQLK